MLENKQRSHSSLNLPLRSQTTWARRSSSLSLSSFVMSGAISKANKKAADGANFCYITTLPFPGDRIQFRQFHRWIDGSQKFSCKYLLRKNPPAPISKAHARAGGSTASPLSERTKTRQSECFLGSCITIWARPHYVGGHGNLGIGILESHNTAMGQDILLSF